MTLFINCVLDCMNNRNSDCLNEHPRADPSSEVVSDFLLGLTEDFSPLLLDLPGGSGDTEAARIVSDSFFFLVFLEPAESMSDSEDGFDISEIFEGFDDADNRGGSGE